ncbi:monofunctional biosynthetic peptidoglycan transglycosylase [Rhizomicrobium palustre]|uniref:monofunctional biosynthetic peptidoglycan transglycosylase n=1 Tax=Rhizomicrobium palustre TaxID=189966 RepID=UPI0014235B21
MWSKSKRPSWLRRILWAVFALLVPLPLAYLVIFRFVPIPITPQMIGDYVTLQEVHQSWRSIDDMSPALRHAVIGSEDQLFCTHHGFDWDDIQLALKQHDEKPGKKLRGASTISQQVARTLFLAPVRSWVRKGLEAYLTVLVEFTWPKKRILEAYLNLVDWGHGNYGAEAAAQAYFHKSAAKLTASEAARLASILPNPDKWKAQKAGKARMSRAMAREHEASRDDLDRCVR